VEGVMASVTHMQQPKSVSDFIKRPVESDGRFAFAERNKLAILSWTTNTVYSASQSFTETPREAENPNDNMEKSFRAWSKGIKRMGKEYGMPQHDFLIYGYSRGAQWSHRLAIRDPKRFAAVHIHVNSSFAEPSKEASGCLWLVTTGELEYGAPAAREFYMKGLAMDFPIMLRIYPNLGHATSNQEARLGIRFFEYALSRLKDKNAQITALEGDAFAKPKLKELASFHRATLEGFVKPSFYGDAVNGDVVPVEKAKMIPEADRIPLPDKAIAEVWGYYPGL